MLAALVCVCVCDALLAQCESESVRHYRVVSLEVVPIYHRVFVAPSIDFSIGQLYSRGAICYANKAQSKAQQLLLFTVVAHGDTQASKTHDRQ